MNTAVLISTFLAASIEVIEMVAIVVAVGATRQWRGALAGTLAGLLVLAVLIAALGTALQRVPLSPIRVVVGALLLTFGLQWTAPHVDETLTHTAAGTPDHVRDSLDRFLGLTNADELITVHPAPTADDRLHSITLLACDFRIAA